MEIYIYIYLTAVEKQTKKYPDSCCILFGFLKNFIYIFNY